MMRILTNRKVQTMSANAIKETFSGFDSTNTDAVKAFQKWFNTNYTIPPFTNKKLAEDGIWGPKTKKASDMYGKEFDKKFPIWAARKPEVVDLKAQQTAPATNLEDKKTLTDKFKALSTGGKVAVVGGGIVVLSLLIWALASKKIK